MQRIERGMIVERTDLPYDFGPGKVLSVGNEGADVQWFNGDHMGARLEDLVPSSREARTCPTCEGRGVPIHAPLQSLGEGFVGQGQRCPDCGGHGWQVRKSR